MPVTLTPLDVGLRIALTLLAGLAIGFDRSAEGHPAGVKTTLLVALAACLAMLQANWLLPTAGKVPGSFVTLDLMRLPLGILTGVGFIGGGAILRRGNAVVGLTTAATLWFVTVIGLCFGGGQLTLGVIGSFLGIGILRVVKALEQRLVEERPAELTIKWRADGFDLDAALAAVDSAGLRLRRFAIKHDGAAGADELRCFVRRRSSPGDHSVPAELANLSQRSGVLAWEWKE